ncbi:effector-associated domain 2-containing protein [Umezawaea sp.]|uniref:VMAP-C domain-containing protein n=1 Tax=Umezawaea sp. TaxID=1955258 RepID=UPI002ECFBE00
MRSPTGPDASLWVLVDALEQVHVLRDPNGRMLCLDLLADELGFTPQVQAFPSLRMHLFSIVLACRQHRDGLVTLLKVLDQMDPRSTTVRRACQVFENMRAADLLSHRERERLLDLFSHTTCTTVAELCRTAAGPAAAEPAVEPEELADALAHLEQLNARSDGLPPLVVFVEHLARRLDGPHADQLRDWNDQLARKLDVVDQLRSLRGRDAEVDPPEVDVEACLVLRIERHGFDRDTFVLTDWRQSHPTGWYPQRGDDFKGSLAEIEARVADLVEEAEAHWARNADSIRVEFLLPHDLLNLPVDQWKLEASTDLPQPLGLRYQVVLRSLERARTHHWHRRWRQRWARLRSSRDHSVNGVPMTHWCSGKARDLGALERVLVLREELVSLVLSAPPPPAPATTVDEVVIGLRSGLPVMIWHRDDGSRRPFDAAIRPLLKGLGELPEGVRLLRGRAPGTVRSTGRIGGHVSLLWDDPDRPVEPVELPTAPCKEVPAP